MTPADPTCLVIYHERYVDLVDTTTKQIYRFAVGEGREYSWSNDGQQIARYSGGIPYIENVETGATTSFGVPDNGAFRQGYRMYDWSPGDEHLAFRFVDRDTKQIGVLNIESREYAGNQTLRY